MGSHKDLRPRQPTSIGDCQCVMRERIVMSGELEGEDNLPVQDAGTDPISGGP
jgi:hypothetical protein